MTAANRTKAGTSPFGQTATYPPMTSSASKNERDFMAKNSGYKN